MALCVGGAGMLLAMDHRGPVVQRLEPSAHNRVVAGSNPAGPTIRVIA